MRIAIGVAIAAVSLVLAGSGAQEAGNPAVGLAFVKANCTSCHAVERTEFESPNFDAPSFAAVAATPGMTGRALAVFLQTPHPTMPNFIIAPADQNNIVAYIMSLRSTGAPSL